MPEAETPARELAEGLRRWAGANREGFPLVASASEALLIREIARLAGEARESIGVCDRASAALQLLKIPYLLQNLVAERLPGFFWPGDDE